MGFLHNRTFLLLTPWSTIRTRCGSVEWVARWWGGDGTPFPPPHHLTTPPPSKGGFNHDLPSEHATAADLGRSRRDPLYPGGRRRSGGRPARPRLPLFPVESGQGRATARSPLCRPAAVRQRSADPQRHPDPLSFPQPDPRRTLPLGGADLPAAAE